MSVSLDKSELSNQNHELIQYKYSKLPLWLGILQILLWVVALFILPFKLGQQTFDFFYISLFF